MKIILSPAKKMNIDTDTLEYRNLPVYLEQTEQILAWLRTKTFAELKVLWRCNEGIALQNFERLKNMELRRNLTPAVLSYEGIAYQYMVPAVFEEGQIAYVQEHLRILSAFYGVLRPLDGVTPYRLEMQAKAGINGSRNLYELWGSRLYKAIQDEDGIIINLASAEYSKCIERYIGPRHRYITVVFCEKAGNKLVTKGTYAKMARGEMVRYLAEHKIEEPCKIKEFDRLGYVFRRELSTEAKYVFERIRVKQKD